MGNDGCNALDGVKTSLFKFNVQEEHDGVVRQAIVLHVIPHGCRYGTPHEALLASQRMQQAECN